MINHVKDLKLAVAGEKRLSWAGRDMPVLEIIKKDFARTKPFKGKRISACMHVTAETANLMLTLQAGGADITLVASNPLSTQDDIAAALVKHGIKVMAVRGEDTKTYYSHLNQALKNKPQITMDDGADLISLLHNKYQNQAKDILGSMEETTTGVIRLRALAAHNKLKLPVIAVNDAKTKNLFDNRYGTGQSTLDGIIRATGILVAGKTIVVAGYGWCGRGFAMRARGMGAEVIVTEVDPIKSLEAAMDGFRVMPMLAAAKVGDVFCTITGDLKVIDSAHFKAMKDGAMVCNSGHFDVEINIPALKKMASRVTRVSEYVQEYLVGKRRIYVLAEGRLINLAAAEGHPSSVMDMSFATQALAAEYVVKQAGKLEVKVHNVSENIENKVATLKLKSLGINIDKLTKEQAAYLSSWDLGT
ncbi:adenosylhomocysteinase [Candidatus Falkowbacteria bacterium]|uniref:Adenosylhomocysteinase n=1 Tax=Candidatus Falkowbacteria bacterium CG10_big_fil_rev_8_21_14_0_10_37_18 TaxID=1974562 RepID=A0A2H0V8E6_9BACT|nr:adenosylhomocysteinase [Candidatus Falkowbacteria bacterium]NCQ13010.1 adenosylhomocysteinase [Candidatus Falkowbacteria bacterium]OIO06564.1 MAG: adenosylhomocysteinase [Candidatus Falkowbacteria bacterium CG1_02_37_21]PIR95384.1 MAG: adenosylhomocysteinase [Candidatus Falkowbacteria bacterium CG10_big_fil_rev_8_21_14_0_10_37_18]